VILFKETAKPFLQLTEDKIVQYGSNGRNKSSSLAGWIEGKRSFLSCTKNPLTAREWSSMLVTKFFFAHSCWYQS